ncbi:energy transducer TonB [Robiginitalea sp. M366]|uniref:energy transducer TonB n=1 Tax=Robiginitalea aestuariiviva TaxID=3036903 RepID=UPI00240CE85B|nr:energy transducer TonB [Robiginitalea aestuariiviva]MDG1570932.1 energy transducer TonB [Robiginitalea aestuariiviva]
MTLSNVFLILGMGLFLSQGVHAQEMENRAERLLLSGCPQGEPDCVYQRLQTQIQPVLKANASLLKDSVGVIVRFRVDQAGQLDGLRLSLQRQTRKAWDAINPIMEDSLNVLTPIAVSNPERGPYPAWHNFSFEFARVNDTVWKPIPSEDVYSGGVVERPPLFPDCLRTDFESDISCFQQRMRAHIVQNFRYPKDALGDGIQGRVVVRFTIDEKGRVQDLRCDSGYPAFQEEGIRIMSKLPRFQPGMRNGLADAWEFALPLMFRLSE